MAATGGGGISPRHMQRISALVAELAVQQQVMAKLVTTSVRAFYGFFTLACLTIAPVALLRGNYRNAAIWGTIGVVLAIGWIAAHLAGQASKAMARELRTIGSTAGGAGSVRRPGRRSD